VDLAVMTPDEARRLEEAIGRVERRGQDARREDFDRLTKQITDLKTDLVKLIDDLRDDVTEQTRFRDGFQSVAKTLAYLLMTLAVLASIYGAVVK
jgi:hypothetical protein